MTMNQCHVLARIRAAKAITGRDLHRDSGLRLEELYEALVPLEALGIVTLKVVRKRGEQQIAMPMVVIG